VDQRFIIGDKLSTVTVIN